MDLSPRLSALVNNALEYPIAEIIAPAGFGKSTVVGAVAKSQAFSVARVRPEVDPSFALMRALCEAVAGQTPDLAAALPNAYSNVRANGRLADLVPWFLESFHAADARIAVDDLHLLGDDVAAWKLLSDVIDNCWSQRAHWILTSRIRTRLPGVEWIAGGYQSKPITEKDLAFNADDILCISRVFGIELPIDRAVKIRDLTKGWPLMSVYALRLIAQGDDFSTVEQVVTVSGIDVVAERLLSQLGVRDIRFLLAIALYDRVECDDLETVHPGASESLNRLIAAGVPLIQGSDGRWYLHDLLRDYLNRREHSLRRIEANRIAGYLDSRGRFGDALRVAVSGGVPETVQHLLERRVRYFADDIDRQLVENAVRLLSGDAQKASWQLAVIRGCSELHRGKVELATHFFRAALALSKGSDRTIAMARLCHSLIFLGDPEGIVALRECDAAELPSDADQACEILSLLAWCFVFTLDIEGAERVSSKAIGLLPRVSDPLIEAIVYVRAGLVALHGGRPHEADEFAKLAIEIGERNRYFEILTRAFLLRNLVAESGRELDAIVFARKSAQYAGRMLDRVAGYWAEASLLTFACRAGDFAEVKALTKKLLPVPDEFDLHIGPTVRISAARGLALEGDYERAATLLSEINGFGDKFCDSDVLAVREFTFHEVEALLFQFRGRTMEAARTARTALALSVNLRLRGAAMCTVSDVEIAKVVFSTILGIHGHKSEAETILEDLAKTAAELYRRDLAKWVLAALIDPSAEPSEEAKARANGVIILIRRVLESAQPSVPLTPAERRVLESLSEGRASKEIAAITGRSVKTVDNQVASIMRKLSARSRGEAVARARRSGLLTDPEREASPV